MPCTLPASLADAAVCRGSFHAVLGGEAGEAVFADFSAALQKAQVEGRILTASLFRYENHLFFYAEGLNRPFTPQGLCPALDAALLPWPPALGEAAPRPWAAMQPYFYHDCLLLASLPRLWRKTSELTAIAAFSLCCNDLLVEPLRYAFACLLYTSPSPRDRG